MKRYEIPTRTAYHDGTRYHCEKIECFIDGANLKEIDRIPAYKPMSYTPILRCSECGTTYFGLITRDHEIEEEITRNAEQARTAKEERAQLAIQDNAESIEEIERLEAEQEQALKEEIDRHSAEENGDIILPNILTL